MNRVERTLSILTDLATLCAACAIVVLIYVKFGPGKEAANAGRESPANPKVGSSITFDGVDWRQSDRTVVLALSSHCPHCKANAGLYREISKRRQSGVLRVIAVFAEDRDAASRFLSEHSVPVDLVVRRKKNDTAVAGVPTVLLVNRDGVLTDSWYGRVTSERDEHELLEQLAVPATAS
jgi:thiol-disulfide isomerase/thioredoxin